MSTLRKVLIAVLLLALSLPAVAASANSMTTQQKFDFLRDKGIFNGYSDGSAGLNDPMTREQFAAVLFRLWSLKEENPAKATYSDVLKTRWSYTNVEAVTKAGLMQGIGNRKFAPTAPVTVEQLATILVRAYGYEGPGSTPVAGKASLWARGSVSIALDHEFIPALSDYTVQAKRSLLVEAAYTAYEEMNGGTLDVSSVQPLNNTTLLVTLNRAVSSIDTSHFLLKNEQGGTVAILQATLSSDGKSVTVTTGYETPNVIHTLYIDGDGWRYTAIPNPSSPPPPVATGPYVTSVTNSADGTLKITFQKPVTKASATDPSHYRITNGNLELKTFALSDDGLTVSIGTSGQIQGFVYQLTVSGVTDLSGNVMNTQTNLTFTGIADRTKPTVKSVTNLGNSSLKVVFSERVDAKDATNERNYKVTGGLNITRATLDAYGSTVTLYTSKQKDGQTYTLSISGIADLAGNVMNPRNDIVFIGFNDTTVLAVVSVTAQDNSTVLVQFSKKVDEYDATNLGNYSIDHGLTVLYAELNEAGDAVTLTTSPQQDGVLYNLKISGIADLAGNVMDAREDLYFGGVSDRIAPYVTAVQAGVKQVVLTFSERLNPATASAVSNYSVDGGLGTPQNAVYDDARRTVTLTTAAQTAGQIYTLTLGQIKDLSGLAVDDDHRKVRFVGVDSVYGGTVSLQELSAVNQNTVQAQGLVKVRLMRGPT